MTRWSVYILRCRDGALYTGIATDVPRRLAEHRRGGGRGAKCLRGRGPLRLLLSAAIGGRGLALKVEARIKRLTKRRKEALLGEAGGVEAIVAAARRRTRRAANRPPAAVRCMPSGPTGGTAISTCSRRRSPCPDRVALTALLDRPRQTV